MKKSLSILTALTIISTLALTGCGKKADTSASADKGNIDIVKTAKVDSISAASKTYFYEKSALKDNALLEAIKQRKGASTVATTNVDGSPNLAVVVPGLADDNTLMFEMAENQTKVNVQDRKIAVLSVYIYNPTAAEKTERNVGAKVVLKLVEDKDKIKQLTEKTKAKEGTIFMEMVKTMPLG